MRWKGWRSDTIVGPSARLGGPRRGVLLVVRLRVQVKGRSVPSSGGGRPGHRRSTLIRLEGEGICCEVGGRGSEKDRGREKNEKVG